MPASHADVHRIAAEAIRTRLNDGSGCLQQAIELRTAELERLGFGGVYGKSERPILCPLTKEYDLRLERNAQPLIGFPRHREKPFDLTRIHHQLEFLRYGRRIEDVKACPAH